MTTFVYILHSLGDGKFYIGCSVDPEKRFLEHFCNKSRYTRFRGPWQIARIEDYPDKITALKREKEIKSWKSHKAIERLINSGVEQPGSSSRWHITHREGRWFNDNFCLHTSQSW